MNKQDEKDFAIANDVKFTLALMDVEDEKPPAGIYFNWCVNALLGLNPVGTDRFLKENLGVIKKVSKVLLVKVGYVPTPLYRGVILREPVDVLKPHPNFTYLSFSEDKSIAESFANPGPGGFGSFHHLGDNGYVISYTPQIDEIIYHYSFLKILPIVEAMARCGIDGSLLHLQKEVTILQPQKEFENIEYLFKNK